MQFLIFVMPLPRVNGQMDNAPKLALDAYKPAVQRGRDPWGGEPWSPRQDEVVLFASQTGGGGESGAQPEAKAPDGGGYGMTSFEKESRAAAASIIPEHQQTQAEKEMREAANNPQQGVRQSEGAPGDGVHALGGTWRVESKQVPDWAASVAGWGAGTAVGAALMPKDYGGSDPVNNAISRGKRAVVATGAGVATQKIVEDWVKEHVKYPSISYAPDPLSPEQQAQYRRNEAQRRHILEATGRDGVYDPTYGPGQGRTE